MSEKWKIDNEFEEVQTCSTCEHRRIALWQEDLVCSLLAEEEEGLPVYNENGDVNEKVIIRDNTVCKRYVRG